MISNGCLETSPVVRSAWTIASCVSCGSRTWSLDCIGMSSSLVRNKSEELLGGSSCLARSSISGTHMPLCSGQIGPVRGRDLLDGESFAAFVAGASLCVFFSVTNPFRDERKNEAFPK